MDEDLAKDVIFDKLEHLVTFDNFNKPTSERTPGMIAWKSMDNEWIGMIPPSLLVRVAGRELCNVEFKSPRFEMVKGDVIHITYRLEWRDGGGGVQLSNPTRGMTLTISYTLAA